MFDFLKNTYEYSESYNEEINIPSNTVDNHDCENILNTNIREEEVLAAVKQLKNNKAAGYNRVLNKHISSTVSIHEFSSPELKAQVSLIDRLSSVVRPSVCKLFLFLTSSLEKLGQF